MSSLSTLPKGDSAWLLRKSIQRIIQQVSVLETNIGSSTTGNSANTQVIFNDNGVLRGDAGLTYNAATDLLSVGSATITGAANLNGAVNLNTAGNSTVLLGSSAGYGVLSGSGTNAASIYINGATRPGFNSVLQFGAAEHQWYNSSLSSLIATLNTTGLGVGGSPTSKLSIFAGADGDVGFFRGGSTRQLQIGTSATAGYLNADNGSAGFELRVNGTARAYFDTSGNVGIGVTPSYKLDTYTTLGGLVTEKRFANRTANKIIVKRYFSITADTALFSVQCGTAGDDKMAAFEINVFATGTKVGISSDRQFYGKFYVTRNAAGTFAITSAFSSGSAGAFTVTDSGTSLNVNGIFSVISDGSACVEISGYIGGRDTIAETNFTVTMP